jgi:hypothetical protein
MDHKKLCCADCRSISHSECRIADIKHAVDAMKNTFGVTAVDQMKMEVDESLHYGGLRVPRTLLLHSMNTMIQHRSSCCLFDKIYTNCFSGLPVPSMQI